MNIVAAGDVVGLLGRGLSERLARAWGGNDKGSFFNKGSNNKGREREAFGIFFKGFGNIYF